MIYTHLFILASLATVSAASEEENGACRPANLTGSWRPWRGRTRAQLPAERAVLNIRARRARRRARLARLVTDMDALLTDWTPTTTVLGLDGTEYAVPLGPGATVAALWPALEAQGGVTKAAYAIYGAPRAGGAPDAPLPDDATVADYDPLFIVARGRPELITAFDPADAHRVTLSGDSNETAEETEGRYDGSVRLGPLVPRGTPLRARLRGLGGGMYIGLVREEAWADVRDTGIERAGWTYFTRDGSLFDNSARYLFDNSARYLFEVPCDVGGVVEVELRWDAETGVGQLLYTIDGPRRVVCGALIPAAGGDVGLAISLYRGRTTLVGE